MIVSLDNSILTLILNPNARPSPDPSTGEPTPYLKQKLDSLLDDLSEANATLIVPATALSETLCVAAPAEELLAKLDSFTCIDTQAFGRRAAVETAELVKSQRKGLKAIRDDATKSWQHLKMDFTIVGVALASGAEVLYTDDGDQSKVAELAGLNVVHTWDLKVTGKHLQLGMFEED